MRHKIQAAIFDMDGVLFDTERLFIDLGMKASALAGGQIPLEVFHSCIGRNNADTKRVVFEAMGSDYPYESFLDNWRDLREEYFSAHGIPMKPGVNQILDRLDQLGLPIAIATSSRKETALFYLSSADLSSRFSVIVGGDEVKAGKPAPDLFFKASSLLGIEPERCIVFEDSMHGARAGIAAGMRVVVVPDLVPPTEEIRSSVFAVCDSLSGAVERLDELLS